MKLKIKYFPKNNCEISLPQAFLNQENVSFDYSKGQISKAVLVKNLKGQKLYLTFNGAISPEKDVLGISSDFGKELDLLEGDIVEPKLESSSQKIKDVDLYCDKWEDYQAIAINRELLERSLLNQISVLYDGIRFPMYYNKQNHVILTFKSKVKITCGYIATDAKVNILCLEEEKKDEDGEKSRTSKQSKQSGIKQPSKGKIDFKVKVRKEIPQEMTMENYLYVDWEVAQKYGLKEGNLYRVYVKNNFWRKKEKSYAKFVRFYKKMSNTKNTEYPNPKKLDYSFLAYIKTEYGHDGQGQPPNNHLDFEDEEKSTPFITIYPGKKLAKRLSRQDEVQIDPDEEIRDKSTCKIIDIFLGEHFLSKITITVYVLYSQGPNEGLNVRKVFQDQLEEMLYQNKKEFLLSNNQLFFVGRNICLAKISERTPEKKYNEIELLKLTNTSQKPKVSGDNKHNNNIFSEILEVKFDVKPEELGLSAKRLEKMLSKYGGVQEKKEETFEFYQQETKTAADLFNKDNNNNKVQKPKVVLVSGPKKSGKTSFIKRLKKSLGESCHWSYIDFKEFISPEKDIERFSLPLIKKFIEYKFDTLHLRPGGVLAFDNLHLLCKHLERIDSMNSHEIIISESLSSFIVGKIKVLEKNELAFSFIFGSEGESFLNERLKKIVTDQINLKQIDIFEKKAFIQRIFDDHYVDYLPKSVEEIVEQTEYMNLNSFVLLKKKIESAVSFQRGVKYKELDEAVLVEIITKSIKEITASTTKNVKTELSFKDIGGLDEVKKSIKETFQNPLKYSFIYKNVPTKLPRGILLYGPSGCGKTMIAAGASVDLKMNFLSVKGPELLNKYIGASEQAVRDIFEKASAQTPCIIFFDEFDSIVPKRNSGSTGVTDRVVNQFLTYLDGVSEIKDVFILAATSRPDLIDVALLRPGRIDKHVYCGYPEKKEREEILKIYTKNIEMEGVDLEKVAEDSEGFSGADLSAMVKNAQIKAVHHLMEETKADPNKPKPRDLIVSKELFDEAYQEIRRTANPNNAKIALKKYSNFADKGTDVSRQKQTLY